MRICYNMLYIWRFPKMGGPKSSILIRSSTIDHPFLGVPPFVEHMYLYVCDPTCTISYTYNHPHESVSSMIWKKHSSASNVISLKPRSQTSGIGPVRDPRSRVPRWLVMVHPSVPWILVFNSSSHRSLHCTVSTWPWVLENNAGRARASRSTKMIWCNHGFTMSIVTNMAKF